MGLSKTIWSKPSEYLRTRAPVDPVMFFAPPMVQAMARRFIDGFPGQVTYAVKANPTDEVIENLAAAGLRGYTCGSPFEIDLIRRILPSAVIHYNNPVRARHEIDHALAQGVVSFAVDSETELAKLVDRVTAAGIAADSIEIAVRFKLPVAGAAYNFGAKFGATSEVAAKLLGQVAAAGCTASLTFHAGSQCTDPAAWEVYILEAAKISEAAGVTIARLNVGGGFPNHRLSGVIPALADIFAVIDAATTRAFGPHRPQLLCEPGRGLCGDAFSLAAQVKAVRDGGHVFLNDGTYGAMAELPQIGVIDRIEVLDAKGERRQSDLSPRVVFGPTSDAIDRLPGEVALPVDIQEGDYVLIHAMGAYSLVSNSRFNGFGNLRLATVLVLKG